MVGLVGSEVINPGYYRSYIGANVKEFLKGNLKHEDSRVISGNVLTGTAISSQGYLGYYDHMITVIPEGKYHDFLGHSKTQEITLSMAIGRLQGGFWSIFHRFWGPFLHRFFIIFFENGESVK